MAAGHGALTSVIYYLSLFPHDLLYVFVFTIYCVTVNDPFNMLTGNAKTSMNSTGKDANTGKTQTLRAPSSFL